ncbi:MAG: DNA-deoxyinosine glycosylase [Clostridia bacterium]|nr:DNA-deoxyinosine glycosylase [Clostridia bacterium]
MKTTIVHTIDPVFDANSRVLILGTMPSPKSREAGFYYMHPQNRFWPALAGVFGEPVPMGREERRAFALRHGIALWDVLQSCDIEGASDASIANAVPNDIAGLLEKTHIARVFTTGATAFKYYKKFAEPQTGVSAVPLPSPSAANARMRLDALIAAYRAVAE